MNLEPLFKLFKKSKTYEDLYKSNAKYIMKLDKQSKAILQKFTKGYDKNLSGLANRNIPLENGQTIPITKARSILNQIIEKAPKLKENIVVYRGKKQKKTYRGFPSYTLDPSIADNFASDMGFNKKGVFEIMKIYKGTPVLFLEAITEYPGEYEILINSKYISVEKGLQHKLQISIAG